MSAIGARCKEWLGKSCIVVARYLGTTTESMDLHSLLGQLVMHLCAVYNLEPPDEVARDSSDKMARVFQNILEQVRSLILICHNVFLKC